MFPQLFQLLVYFDETINGRFRRRRLRGHHDTVYLLWFGTRDRRNNRLLGSVGRLLVWRSYSFWLGPWLGSISNTEGRACCREAEACLGTWLGRT